MVAQRLDEPLRAAMAQAAGASVDAERDNHDHDEAAAEERYGDVHGGTKVGNRGHRHPEAPHCAPAIEPECAFQTALPLFTVSPAWSLRTAISINPGNRSAALRGDGAPSQEPGGVRMTRGDPLRQR